MEKLETLELNVQTGTVKVNGIDKSRVSYFKLEFDGVWRLTVTENFRTTEDEFCVKSGKKKVTESERKFDLLEKKQQKRELLRDAITDCLIITLGIFAIFLFAFQIVVILSVILAT